MKTVVVFDRTITTLTAGTISFDFCTRMDTGIAVSTVGYTLTHLGVGMYILDVPNATAGTIFSISSTALTPQVFTQGVFTNSIDVADGVWNSRVNDYDDVANSFGRRIRNIAEDVIWSGTVVGSTINTITLDSTASISTGAYDPAEITILVDGESVGQCRMILQYDPITKTVVVDRNWKHLPDAGATAVITANSGREHINEGLAQAGSYNTITLNELASDYDNAYVGQIVFIRSGEGDDQARRIVSYNGTTKVATMCDPWLYVPNNTSGYVVLPTASLAYDYISRGVYDAPTTLYNDEGSRGQQQVRTYEEARRARALASNNVTINRTGQGDSAVDIITLFDDDLSVLYTIEVFGDIATNRRVTYKKVMPI